MGIETMDLDRDVTVYLSKARTSAPAELREFFAKFEDLYDKKLWHQLTLVLLNFVNIPSAAPYLVPVYNEFIIDFAKKLNQLSLVQYATKASRTLPDPEKSLAFLFIQVERLKDDAEHKEAFVLATMECAHIKLLLNDLEGCKTDIDQCEKILDDLPATDPVINASFYRVSADYYKAKAQYPQYYMNALLYLSSVSLDELSATEKSERAYDLALSALLGDGVYNFGQLLMHPILDSLKGTSFDWLRDLLFCFNSGDGAAFEKISRSPEFLKRPLLVSSIPFLSQKLCLMALMEAVFRRSKEERGKLTFSEISVSTRVANDEVEHLVMKALSLGLLKGSIDEIDQTVNISWVQPRVLDLNQVQSLKDRLNEWTLNVKQKVLTLESDQVADHMYLG
ncbi:26S proteasome regulatory subunit [Blyttiomyces sp. JEL0837]|nr:26S proteasome regulatory subunit [Blyttiomyces sp. JEL0837]